MHGAISDIWRNGDEANQPPQKSPNAAEPYTPEAWGDDELSTTEHGSPAPTFCQVDPIKHDTPGGMQDDELSTTEAGTPEPIQPHVNVTTSPKGGTAAEPTINGPTEDLAPPIVSHHEVRPPIPIYNLSSPPPTVPYNLEEFLQECFIPAEDLRTQFILQHHKIYHWFHFIKSDEAELRDMGLDQGPARALCERARARNYQN
jgi:hypothetical protein